MKIIKVLGTGCANCKTTLKLIEDAAKAKGVAGFWVEHKCNWKLAGRAFLDHAEAPKAAAPAKQAKARHRRGSSAANEGVGHALRTIALTKDVESELPGVATLDEPARGEARFAWAFPNLLIAALPDHLVTIGLQPTSFSSTLYRVRLYVSADAKRVGADHPAVVKRLGFWREMLTRCGERAAAEQREAERWGTPSWPETDGKKRPIETSEHGYRLQRYLVDRLLAAHDYHWAGPMTDARVR